MKILIPIILYSKAGGIKVLTNLANYWAKYGHEVTIVLPAYGAEFYYPLNCKIVTIDLKGEETQKIESSNGIQKVVALCRYLAAQSNNFDVVIANFHITAYPVAFFSKAFNFYYIQAYEPEFYNDPKYNFLEKYFYKSTAWLSYYLPLVRIVNSNMYKIYKNIRAEYVVLPGVDLNIYFPSNREPKKFDDKFIVGCIGRTEEWKGSNDVAMALKALHNKGYSNIDFVVAFHSVAYPNHKLVKPDGDLSLANFYHSLDILVTPGHIQLDAVHYPVIEALITKTPLITTGYFPSTKENSTLVAIKSPHEIAEKIEYLIHHYDEAILKANVGYEEASQFGWEIVSKKFIDIINFYLEARSVKPYKK